MTKEEILSSKPQFSRVSFGLSGDKTPEYTTIAATKEAMDEYAKQQAIAYDIWKRVNGYALNYPNYEYVKLVVTGDKAVTSLVPIDEVYAQFIEQQSKP